MRGEVGTDITLTIIRAGEDDTFDVTLTREIIRPKSVVHRIEDEDIGYVRISSFNERTTELLDESLTAIREELGPNPAGLIIDLRNNPGGLLDQACLLYTSPSPRDSGQSRMPSSA